MICTYPSFPPPLSLPLYCRPTLNPACDEVRIRMSQHLTAEVSKTFPTLEEGVSHLERPTQRSIALHRIVIQELQERDGVTFWVDSRNNASTYILNDLAPSPRTLEGIQIARAFTAYQHHTLVRKLIEKITPRTSLVVIPCIPSLYGDDDVPGQEGEDLLEASLSILRELSDAYEIPVLVTTSGESQRMRQLVTEYSETTIEATKTDQGFKYSTDEFETQIYWDDGFWQTTIPYWVELLGAVNEETIEGPSQIDVLNARV